VSAKQPFEAVVTLHGATVLRVCRAVLGSVDADDAWSETFLSALKAYPELPADANVQAWLVTIAHRKAIDVTRAAARRAVPVAELSEPGDRVAAGATAAIDAIDAIDANWLHDPAARTSTTTLHLEQDLVDALAALPPRQRHCVAYHFLGGLPYAEVAAVIGGSPDAARRAAADGIAALRRTYPGVAAPEGELR
jgi:RNA polymerase sigma factor (sigma-70 family)